MSAVRAHLELLLFLAHLSKLLEIFAHLFDLSRVPISLGSLVVVDRDDVTADVIAGEADVIVAFFPLSGQRQHVANVGVIGVIKVLVVAVIFDGVLTSQLQLLALASQYIISFLCICQIS